MNFAHVHLGAVVRYFTELPFTFNGVAQFRSLTPAERAALGVVPVVDLTPGVDALTHRFIKATPIVAVYPDCVEIVRLTEEISLAEQAAALSELHASALVEIDTRAEAVRLRYITPGAGQAATYLLKERQTEAYRAAGYTGTVPALVQAEMDATGRTAQAACDLILFMRDTWVVKAAQIESARRRGKVAVEAAPSGAEVRIARDAALAALNLL